MQTSERVLTDMYECQSQPTVKPQGRFSSAPVGRASLVSSQATTPFRTGGRKLTQLVWEKKRSQAEKETIILATDSLLPTFHWNLNTDRTGKIAFLGALPWIA